MLADDLRQIKVLVDEAFSEVDCAVDFRDYDVKWALLAKLDEIGILLEECLSHLTE
jgi:hypothetical protein